MELIPLGNLIVRENRIRKLFNSLENEGLADSIEDLGLMHAPVVEKDGVTLVAGERRLRAIILLNKERRSFYYNGEVVPFGEIPVVNLVELTSKKYKEAEYEENVRRINITWQEKAAAVAEFHSLREEQAAELGKVQTPKDTSRELAELSGDERGHELILEDVKIDLLVSTYSDDPEIRKAKTREEAFKLVEKRLDREHKERLAREFELSIKDTSIPHNLIQGDLFKELPKLDDETFSCIISDPPYGIGADSFANQAADKHTYDDTPESSNSIILAIAKEGFRLATQKAHLYIFCDINRFTLVKTLVSNEGWNVWPTPLIWFRGASSGIAPRPHHGPRRVYECILFANKGNRRTNKLGTDCLVEFPHIKEGVARAANKPVSLYKYLMELTCFPGDMVLDPCCGSGSIFPAADQFGCIAWGIEIDRYGAGIAASRIRELRK